MRDIKDKAGETPRDENNAEDGDARPEQSETTKSSISSLLDLAVGQISTTDNRSDHPSVSSGSLVLQPHASLEEGVVLGNSNATSYDDERDAGVFRPRNGPRHGHLHHRRRILGRAVSNVSGGGETVHARDHQQNKSMSKDAALSLDPDPDKKEDDDDDDDGASASPSSTQVEYVDPEAALHKEALLRRLGVGSPAGNSKKKQHPAEERLTMADIMARPGKATRSSAGR